MLKIATWNVNSIKARLPLVLEWLTEAEPDVALLQEIKCVDDGFPGLEIGELGYNVAVSGQKTYNGVAILSKRPIDVVERGLPGDGADSEARYLEADVGDVRVASIYLPNGNPVDGPRFPYKLKWIERLTTHVRKLLKNDQALVLGGDYNVCPTDDDVYDPKLFANDALCRPESRGRYRALVYLGLTDAVRVFNTEAHCYTYWDYTGGAWQRDNGLRIDHILLSPQAADRIAASGVDRTPRKKPRPSDHTPVWCTLAEADDGG